MALRHDVMTCQSDAIVSERLLDLDKCTVMHFRLNTNEEVMELGGKLLVHIQVRVILASLFRVI